MVSGRIHSMTNQKAWDDFFTIPAGFRPTTGVLYGIGYIQVNNVGWIPILCRIDDITGNVNIGYSANETTGQVGFYATYKQI